MYSLRSLLQEAIVILTKAYYKPRLKSAMVKQLLVSLKDLDLTLFFSRAHEMTPMQNPMSILKVALLSIVLAVAHVRMPDALLQQAPRMGIILKWLYCESRTSYASDYTMGPFMSSAPAFLEQKRRQSSCPADVAYLASPPTQKSKAQTLFYPSLFLPYCQRGTSLY